MTSEDVVFSILRAKQRTSDFKEYISTISGVKAIDKYTVQIKQVNQIQLNQLSNIFIMSKEWSAKNFALSPQNWDADKKHFLQRMQWGLVRLKLL